MKRYHFFLLSIIILLGSILTGCTGSASLANSWPEVSADQNTAYLADASYLYAIRLQDGSLAWKYPEKAVANKSFYSHPDITKDGKIIVGDYANQLISLDSQTGAEGWVYDKAKDRYIGSPLVVDNLVFAPNGDHTLYAVDTSGQEKWKFKTGDPIWTRPVSDGKNVFVASMDHHLYALDLSSGNKIWDADLGGAVIYSLALSDDKSTLFTGTVQNELLAVDAASGKITWRFKANGIVWARAVQNKDRIFFGDQSGKIYAVNVKDGSKAWEQDTGAQVVGTAAVLENGVAFPVESGSVNALDFDGKTLWNQTINGKLYSDLIFTGKQLLVPVTTGENSLLLVALSASGSQVWAFNLPK
jgi:eukaryotic-like serine/threonine-protein kinase